MKYQIGDKVLILHSEEEGTIIDFINDKMVMVDVRGVKFPVYLDQIDFPYFRNFTQKKNSSRQSPGRLSTILRRRKKRRNPARKMGYG